MCLRSARSMRVKRSVGAISMMARFALARSTLARGSFEARLRIARDTLNARSMLAVGCLLGFACGDAFACAVVPGPLHRACLCV